MHFWQGYIFQCNVICRYLLMQYFQLKKLFYFSSHSIQLIQVLCFNQTLETNVFQSEKQMFALHFLAFKSVLFILSIGYFSLMLCDVLIYTQTEQKYALLSLLFMPFDSFLLPVYEKKLHCIINSFLSENVFCSRNFSLHSAFTTQLFLCPLTCISH